ncbi:MAG: hypothetical protein KDE45_15955 [Caldilineaceae bacterium]|nr:hypothetical protein [Caldilineaceae bacterium]
MALVALLMFWWTNPGFLVDDATITYRYALNIAQGNGFVYNLGEHIQGTTTPLFTLILAVFALLGMEPIQAGPAIGLVSGVLAVVVTFLLGRSLAGWLAGLGGAVLLASSAHFAANVSSGMETPLYVLLILTAFLLLYGQHFALAAFVSGLCILMRLDGLAVPAAVLIGVWMRTRRIPWKEAAIVLLTALPWFVFAQLYFGSLLPLSLVAKQSHIKLADPFWMIRFLINTPFEMLLAPILIFYGTLLSRRKQVAIHTVPLVLWLSLYVLAYSFVNIDAYDWYNVPPIPVLYILFGVAVAEITARFDFPVKRNQILAGLAVIAFVMVFQIKYNLALVPAFKRQAVAVEGTRVEVGEWLYENTPADATIASDGIGHIGYYSDRYVIDLLGLVTPYAIGRTYVDTLDHFNVDYAISVVRKDGGHPFKSSEFLSRYEFVREWPASEEYVGSHVLYRRKSN